MLNLVPFFCAFWYCVCGFKSGKLFDKVVQFSYNAFRFPFSLSFINFTTLYHLNGFIKNVKLVIAGVNFIRFNRVQNNFYTILFLQRTPTN